MYKEGQGGCEILNKKRFGTEVSKNLMHNFIRPAQKLWDLIPSEVRMKVLNSVWCGKCADAVTCLILKDLFSTGSRYCVGKVKDVVEM